MLDHSGLRIRVEYGLILFTEKDLKISRCNYARGVIPLEYEQVFVPGHDVVSLRLACTGKNSVIIRVSADRSNRIDLLKHYLCGFRQDLPNLREF